MARAPLAIVCAAMVCAGGCNQEDPGTSPEAPPPQARPVDKPEPEEPAQPLIEGFVVLPDGTSVRTEPRDDAPTLTVGARPGGGRGHVFAVAGIENELVAIENVRDEQADAHCAATVSWLEPYRIRLYVREGDLAPVTARSAIAKFDDGTSVMLSAGVPLRALQPAAEGRRRFEADAAGLPLSVLVELSAVGRSYRPGAKFKPSGPVAATVAEPELRYDGRRLDELNALMRNGDGVAVFDDEAVGGQRRLTMGNRCAELRVLAAGSVLASAETKDGGDRYGILGADKLAAIDAAAEAGLLGVLEADEDGKFYARPIGEPGGGGVGVGRFGATTHEIRQGAKVYWPDGDEAGEVQSKARFASEPTTKDARQCFVLPAREGWTLCFDEADVEKLQPVAFGIGGGGGGFGAVGGLHGSRAGTGWSGPGLGTLGTKKAPKARLGKAAVKGSLDKDVIRRIVRAHINEVRYCYEQALVGEPTLAGKVTVELTIGSSGTVSVAKVGSSTLGDASVESCITKAVRRWRFPKPAGGGVVVVSYPFVFVPG